jgi:hypothetical protein
MRLAQDAPVRDGDGKNQKIANCRGGRHFNADRKTKEKMEYKMKAAAKFNFLPSIFN